MYICIIKQLFNQKTKKMSKLLITGATGHLGTATIKQLLQKTSTDNIVAFARDENKVKDLVEKGVEVRYGNFDDITSLEKAVQGMDKVLIISTVDPNRYQQQKNVVDAAKKAGVRHVAYTSGVLKDVNASPLKSHFQSHFQTEDYIKESGLSYTILGNTLYAEVIPVYVGDKVFETGVYLPAGNGKVPFALRREMGEATANALLEDGYENKTYQITGGELYSYKDVAKILSEIAGKTVRYVDADMTTFEEQLKQAGASDMMISIVSGINTDIKNHQYEIVSDDLENLLGRKPATLEEALKEIYNW